MKRRKTKFITAPCRRGCGKILLSAKKSLLGLDELKRKYELICNDCLTEEEHKEMLEALGEGVAKISSTAACH